MDAFEYLSVLISIVLGLGITQLLTGFGRWLEHRAAFRVYAPAILWAAFLLIVHVQTWWSMFGLRYWEEWSFAQFSAVLLQPVVLYLMTVLAFPGAGSEEKDMREHFFLQRPWFFGLFLGAVLVSILKEVLREGRLPEAPNLAFHGLLFAIGGTAAVTEREGLHHALAATALLVMVAYIVLLFAELA